MPLNKIEVGTSPNDGTGSSLRTAFQLTNLAMDAIDALVTPRICYVETSGNDSTGAIGNPAFPFATCQAAYAAGVATGLPFLIQLGVGTFTLTSTVQIDYSLLKGISGRAPALTDLTISNTPNSGDGSSGFTTTLFVSNMTLLVSTLGCDNVSAEGGDGGIGNVADIRGANCNLSVNLAGGAASSGVGGSGGTLRCYGGFKIINYSAIGGLGTSGNGPDGGLEVDGCDLTVCSFGSNPLSSTVARCSYTGSTLTPTNNLGGNAVY